MRTRQSSTNSRPLNFRRGAIRGGTSSSVIRRNTQHNRIHFSSSTDDDEDNIEVINVATKQDNGKFAKPVILISDESDNDDNNQNDDNEDSDDQQTDKKSQDLVSDDDSYDEDNQNGTNQNDDRSIHNENETLKGPYRRPNNRTNNRNGDKEEEETIDIISFKDIYNRGKGCGRTRRAFRRPIKPTTIEGPKFRRRALQKISDDENDGEEHELSFKYVAEEVKNPFTYIKQTQNLPNPTEDLEMLPFIIIRNQKMFSSLKLKMMQDERLIYTSNDGKDNCHFVSDSGVEGEISTKENCCGYVRGRNKNTTFTVYCPTKLSERDDREGELIGMCFSIEENQPSVFLEMQKNGEPHYAVSERLMLETLAKEKQTNINNYFCFESIEFETNQQKDLKSAIFRDNLKKVTIVEKETQVPVFTLSKSTADVFIMKMRPPLTQFQAYGIVISLLKLKI